MNHNDLKKMFFNLFSLANSGTLYTFVHVYTYIHTSGKPRGTSLYGIDLYAGKDLCTCRVQSTSLLCSAITMSPSVSIFRCCKLITINLLWPLNNKSKITGCCGMLLYTAICVASSLYWHDSQHKTSNQEKSFKNTWARKQHFEENYKRVLYDLRC